VNQLGGVLSEDLASVTLEVFVTLQEPLDSVTVYGLNDGAKASGAALSETSWTGGVDGTEAGGNNMEGNNRPDGPQSLPNSYTTEALGTFVFGNSTTDTGLKQITITDLEGFRDLISSDTNGEITLMLRGNRDGVQTRIASVFNTSGHPVPTLTAVGDAPVDSTPPAVPVGLVALPGNGMVQLNWSDNQEGDLAAYRVYRREDAEDPFVLIHSTETISEYTDSAVVSDTSYAYRLSAVDVFGNESDPGQVVAVHTWTDQQQYFDTMQLPYDADPDGNADGDAFTNREEYLAGTDPNNAESIFQLVPLSESGGIRIQAPRLEGRFYRVSFRESLSSGEWTVVEGDDGTVAHPQNPEEIGQLDLLVTDDGFYRVEGSDTAFPEP
jgi:hypothetical protein